MHILRLFSFVSFSIFYPPHVNGRAAQAIVMHPCLKVFFVKAVAQWKTVRRTLVVAKVVKETPNPMLKQQKDPICCDKKTSGRRKVDGEKRRR